MCDQMCDDNAPLYGSMFFRIFRLRVNTHPNSMHSTSSFVRHTHYTLDIREPDYAGSQTSSIFHRSTMRIQMLMREKC